jgi:hypothetical protein
MPDDRVVPANRAPPRKEIQRDHPGSMLSFASGSAIKIITVGVKARRDRSCQVSIRLAGPSPSGKVSFERKKNTAFRCETRAPHSQHWPVFVGFSYNWPQTLARPSSVAENRVGILEVGPQSRFSRISSRSLTGRPLPWHPPSGFHLALFVRRAPACGDLVEGAPLRLHPHGGSNHDVVTGFISLARQTAP